MSKNQSSLNKILSSIVKRPDGSLAWKRLLATGLLVAIYFVLQPWASQTLGLNLPGWNDLTQSPSANSQADQNERSSKSPQAGSNDSKKVKTKKATPNDEGSSVSVDRGVNTKSPNKRAIKSSKDPPSGEEDLSTFLKEIRPKVFQSPAGLIYTPGSRHKHRLKHIFAHQSDQPNRTGKHSVFKVQGKVALLKLLDEAYLLAESGKQTQTKQDRRRTIHTVNMKRNVGFIGGQYGKKNNYPKTNKIRLVLEKQNVITAYPF